MPTNLLIELLQQHKYINKIVNSSKKPNGATTK